MNRMWGVRLGDVVEVTMGQAPTGDTYNDGGIGLPLIAGAGDFGETAPEVKKFTSLPTKVCVSGDIVMSIRATIGTKVVADRQYCLGRGVAGLRAGDAVDPRYLWHWLGHNEHELASKGRGATFPQVSRSDIADMALELPPLDEQRRIAAILDRADALRQKRKRAIALLDSLPKSIFLEMFGDTRSGSAWQFDSLAALGKVHTGKTPPTSEKELFEGVIPFMTPGDLETDGPAKRFLSDRGAKFSKVVPVGSALVCCIGATIGKMSLASSSVSFNQQINAVEWSNRILPEFGLEALRFAKDEVISRAISTTLPILKKSEFEKINIPVPPIDLQQLFADRVAAFGRVASLQRTELGHVDALVSSLQHRAFSGQL